MILRRFMQHVKEQNWFAVGLDVIVVIVGIFLGMQVQQWYEERKSTEEWRLALDNLKTEFDVNILAVKNDINILTKTVTPATTTLASLLKCQLDEADEKTFHTGLQSMRGAVGLAVRKRALESILTDTRFQSFLSADKREYLQELITWLEFIESEAQYFENLPFEDLPEKHTAIKLLTSVSEESYPFSRLTVAEGVYTEVGLAIPFGEACNDMEFVKAVEWWVKWQTRQLTVANQLVQRLDISTKEIQTW